MALFNTLWQQACSEKIPDPKGAAGQLVAALGELLDAQQVEYAQIENEAVFLFDLGNLEFKGMDFNVVMVAHPPSDPDDARRQSDLLNDYRTALKSDGLCFQVFLSPEVPANAAGGDGFWNVVNLCGSDLEQIFASSVPTSTLFALIRRQVPVQRLCPFNTTRAEPRGSMFRGRRSELDCLTSDLETHYVVSGARRIGKTSLLTRAYDKLRMQPVFRGRTFFFNCLTWGNSADCFRRLAHAIDPRKEQRINFSPRNITYMLERRTRRGSQPLLLFFDEVDRIIDTDAQAGWAFFNVLAGAAGEAWIRVVFAGYRSMNRLAAGKSSRAIADGASSDSPFYATLEPLELSSLSSDDCRRLILEPFSSMNIAIHSQEAVLDRIWKITTGHPFLLQFIGEKLFHLGSERSPQHVTIDDVHGIEQGFVLRDFLLTHFLQNAQLNGKPEPYEQLSGVLLAHAGDGVEWDETSFLTKMAEARPGIGLDVMHAALRNLVLAHVLTCPCGRYSFTFPMLARVLRETYPDVQKFINVLFGPGSP